jgi:hypothetical protein
VVTRSLRPPQAPPRVGAMPRRARALPGGDRRSQARARWARGGSRRPSFPVSSPQISVTVRLLVSSVRTSDVKVTVIGGEHGGEKVAVAVRE